MGSALNERLLLGSWQETRITVAVSCSDPLFVPNLATFRIVDSPRETLGSREGRSATRARPPVEGVLLLLVLLMLPIM